MTLRYEDRSLINERVSDENDEKLKLVMRALFVDTIRVFGVAAKLPNLALIDAVPNERLTMICSFVTSTMLSSLVVTLEMLDTSWFTPFDNLNTISGFDR